MPEDQNPPTGGETTDTTTVEKTQRRPGEPRPQRQAAAPERVMKGTREIVHDLFKLRPAMLKRNISWKYKLPSIIELEHSHVFHSIDGDTFQPNKYCAPVGGHFHEITVDWDRPGKDGGPLVTCGPALQIIKTRVDDEVITEIVPVEFEVHEKLKKKGRGDIVDNHTHEVEYIDSETLSARAQNDRRQAERDKISRAMSGTG